MMNSARESKLTLETEKDSEFTELKEVISEILSSSEEFVMDLVKKVSGELEGSIKNSSEHVANRLIALKNEMSISKHVREHPWQWIGIAGLAGFSIRLLSSSNQNANPQGNDVNPVATSVSLFAAAALPLLTLAIEEFGTGLLKSRRSVKD